MRIAVDDRAVAETLRNLANNIPDAAARALNYVGFNVRKAEQNELRTVFDRPTPYIIKSVWVTKATDKKLEVVVGPNDYLNPKGLDDAIESWPWEGVIRPHVFGGSRLLKKFEERLQTRGLREMPTGWFAVPGPGMPLDAYGNPKTNELLMLLSWVDVLQTYSEGAMQNRFEKVSKRKNITEKRGESFFIAARGSKKAANYLRPGVYKRRKDGTITAMLFFVSKVRYRQRLDWFGVGERIVAVQLPAQTEKVLRRFVMRSRPA